MSGVRKAGLLALFGAIIGTGGYGCKKKEPIREPIKEDTATTEAFDKESIIRKQLQEVIDREIKNQKGALVALYLDAEDIKNVTGEAEYRCYSDPGRRGSYSGIWRVPYRTAWTRWERVSQSTEREIVIDPGPPHKTFTKVVTLIPGEAANLGHIVLEKVKAEGTASISGTIRDENGEPLEGVKISSKKGIAATNAEGLYRIDGFGLEVCELEATKDGYIPYPAKVSIRDMDERIIKQDFVLSYPREVGFRYVISPKEKDDFSDPDATSGAGEFLVDRKYFPLSPDQFKNEDFRTFVGRVHLNFRVNDDKLTLSNSYAPIYYKSLSSSSEQFEAINHVAALGFKSQRCPAIQEGDIILIDGGKISEYTLKILFEKVQKQKQSYEAEAETQKPATETPPTTLNISYADFPPRLQAILDERTAELQANGGLCIAGQVKFSDGSPIRSGKDIMINLHHNADVPLDVYEGGWFIMRRTLQSYYAGPDKGFILRAFGYDPIDASITILSGEITYVDFEMKKTPPDKLACVKGVVTDDHDRPVEGAHVSISFPFAYRARPEMITQTDPNGEYSFEGLSGAEHGIYFSKSGYAPDSDKFTPHEGATVVKGLKLYPEHRITIDYVYQADGSRNFASGELQTGTIDWRPYKGGVDFSEGQVEGYEPNDLRDLELRQEKSVLKFRVYYAKSRNGFYDAGAVSLDSVTEAAETGYTRNETPCKVGHVYVVRTYEEDNYAKFIVKSVETF
ncbi:MAG: carboxypeptidase regulatory-like domain-containing protein [Sedimentisphaerales bacterium]|nr:carboxypeptidase regulatory-like domain-containing protein [Sedimentisphaerales bacterium]